MNLLIGVAWIRRVMSKRNFYADIKKPVRHFLLGLTTFIVLTVSGIGWFQYQQVERVTRSAAQGYENFVWNFFQLELHQTRYQDALNRALMQPEQPGLLADVSMQYNIFASQVLMIEKSEVMRIMQMHAIFKITLAEAQSYLQKADPYLENSPKTLAVAVMQALLTDSHTLQSSVHRLVLEAHELQSVRSSQTLEDIRRFALYGGISAAFLLILSVVCGFFSVHQIALTGRRQRELEVLHQEASHRASHDFLTNLVNRFEFEKHLRRKLDLSRKLGIEHVVMFVDLDRFKIVNDTCGHSAGDQLLCEVVRVISNCMRSTDTFARLGGDEFGVILAHCGPQKAAEVAEQIRKVVDDYRFEYEGRRFHIGASIGWVLVHKNWVSTAAILNAADAACYVAKNSGRNRVHAYEDNQSVVLAQKDGTLWVQRLEEALDTGSFELHWQCIVPIQTGHAHGSGVHGEVLLRMVDADGRRISPGEFVPVAERFFLASRMDRWVVRAVFEWMLQHENELQHLDRLSVNLSGQSVGDAVFRSDLLAMMDRMPVNFHKICFEVTETSAINNLKESVVFFDALRARGAKISLDDFGSGMSSFGYLKTLPADVLKIDGQFMRNLLADPVDRVCIQSMVQLARVTHMETIAEWVETESVEDLLRELGVDYVQGYLHHHPEPLDHLLKLAVQSPAGRINENSLSRRHADSMNS